MKLLKNLTIVFYFINLYLKESKIKEQQIEKQENVPLKAKTYSDEKMILLFFLIFVETSNCYISFIRKEHNGFE